MDFAKLMSAQISRSPPVQQSRHKGPSDKNVSATFQKRGEVEAVREAAYRAEQAALEAERIAKTERKRQREEDDAEHERQREAKKRRLAAQSRRRQLEEDEAAERKRRRKLGLSEVPVIRDKKEHANHDEAHEINRNEALADHEDIAEEDLRAKLRELVQPVAVFGEDHVQRLERYRSLAMQPAGHLQSPSSSVKPAASDPTQPIPTTLQSFIESDVMMVSSTVPAPTDTQGRLHLARQLSTWFNLVLAQWSAALAARDPATASTFAGRAALNSYTQALSHLRPLFRKLEKLHTDPAVLPPDLLGPTCSIVRLAQERRYVDANDGYLQLSIGKAAWPIGVTMVGIHERSAREKIGEAGGAHILSDEMTRKWLQSIKRCLSFAQTRWPPEDAGQLMG